MPSFSALPPAYIHIGLPKTGTKSIQFALASRRSKLLQHGWLYPLEGTTTNRTGHHALAWHLMGAQHQHPALVRFDPGTLRNNIMRAANKAILLSAEDFCALSGAPARIGALFNFLPKRDIFAVVYVREQSEFLNSIYTQRLDELLNQSSIQQYVQSVLASNMYDYELFLGQWRSMLDRRLIVRVFDQQHLVGGGPVTDFAQTVGIAAALRPLTNDVHNARRNTLQVAALQGLATFLTGRVGAWELFSPRHRHMKRALTDLLQHPALREAPPYSGIRPALRRRIRLHYRMSNARFLRDTVGAEVRFSFPPRTFNAVDYRDLPAALRAELEEGALAALAAAPYQDAAAN